MTRRPVSQWEAYQRRQQRKAYIAATFGWLVLGLILLAVAIVAANVTVFLQGCVR